MRGGEEDLMPTTVTTPALLAKLQIKDVNPGACAGADRWIAEPGAQELVSYNPTTAEPLARVLQASADAYDQVVAVTRLRRSPRGG
jgi:hypothetical protein